MSGIYIKGMEMPEFGEKIIILTSSGYVEDVSGQVIQGIEAVSVPDHGRLGDLDELYTHLNEWYLTHRGGMSPTETLYVRAMLTGIKDAPTIISTDIETMFYPQVDGITPSVVKGIGT